MPMKMMARIRPVAEQIDGERRAGVAGGGARGPAGADHAGMRERGRHAVVFEAAGRIHALVLQIQAAGVHADVLGDGVGALQDASALRRWS